MMNTNVCCQYIEGLIEQKPDLYFIEIQEQVNKVLDINVSKCTISNSPKHCGLYIKEGLSFVPVGNSLRLMYLEVSVQA